MPKKTLTFQTLSEQTGTSGEEILNRFKQTALHRGPAEEVIPRPQVTVISKSQLWPLDSVGQRAGVDTPYRRGPLSVRSVAFLECDRGSGTFHRGARAFWKPGGSAMLWGDIHMPSLRWLPWAEGGATGSPR